MKQIVTLLIVYFKLQLKNNHWKFRVINLFYFRSLNKKLEYAKN